MKTSEKIITFAAIFISLLALVVSISQTRIMQKQQHASVWPRLAQEVGFGPDHFEYIVKNEGIGPALVDRVEYHYMDTSFYFVLDMMKYFLKLEKHKGPYKAEYSNIIAGEVIGVGEEINLFKAEDSTAVQIAKKYFFDVKIELDYCSIYNRCWKMQDDEVSEL